MLNGHPIPIPLSIGHLSKTLSKIQYPAMTLSQRHRIARFPSIATEDDQWATRSSDAQTCEQVRVIRLVQNALISTSVVCWAFQYLPSDVISGLVNSHVATLPRQRTSCAHQVKEHESSQPKRLRKNIRKEYDGNRILARTVSQFEEGWLDDDGVCVMSCWELKHEKICLAELVSHGILYQYFYHKFIICIVLYCILLYGQSEFNRIVCVRIHSHRTKVRSAE